MSSLSLMHQSPCCMTPTLVIRTYLCTAHQASRRLFSDARPSKALKLHTHTPPLPTSLPPSLSFSPNISYAVLWGHKVLLLLLLLHPQPSCQHCPGAPRSPPLSAPITSSPTPCIPPWVMLLHFCPVVDTSACWWISSWSEVPGKLVVSEHTEGWLLGIWGQWKWEGQWRVSWRSVEGPLEVSGGSAGGQ